VVRKGWPRSHRKLLIQRGRELQKAPASKYRLWTGSPAQQSFLERLVEAQQSVLLL
jgi:hypothetical protein